MRLHVKTKLRKEKIHLILLKEVKTIEVVIEEEEVVVTMAMEGVDKVMKDKEIKEEGISNKSIKKIQFALF